MDEKDIDFKTLIDNSPDVIARFDRSLRHLYINQKATDELGLPVEFFIGKTNRELAMPEDVVCRWENALKAVFETKKVQNVDIEYETHQGKKYYTSRLSPEFDGNGSVSTVISITTDITESKRAEEGKTCHHLLGSLPNAFEKLVDTVPGVLCQFCLKKDGHAFYPYSSPSVMEVYGIPPEELSKDASPIFSRIHTDDQERIENDVRQSAQRLLPLHNEHRFMHPVKGEIWLENQFIPTRENDGSTIWHGFIMDITKRKQAEETLRLHSLVLDQIADLVTITDLNGAITYVNKTNLKKLKRSREEIIQSSIEILGEDPQRGATQKEIIEKTMESGAWRGEVVNIDADGKDLILDCRTQLVYDDQNKAIACCGISTDITKSKEIEESLRESEKRLNMLLSQTSAVIYSYQVLHAKKKITYVNDNIQNILGFGPSDFVEDPDLFPACLHPEDAPILQENLNKVLSGEKIGPIEYRFKDKAGKYHWIHEEQRIIENKGDLVEVVGTWWDITDRIEAEKELIYLSYHDQLTGAYNRRFFEEELKRVDTKNNLPITLIVGDINGLKLINDSFGHNTGDILLQKVMEIIQKGCSYDDIIARIGGDEFVILLPKTVETMAIHMIQRIKKLASHEKIAGIDLSVSFGYATKEKENDNIVEVLANAENHMYRHKLYEHASARSKIIDIIMNTLFEKSNRESLHSKRVSKICQSIASKMNFEKDDINQVRLAGLIHDIGKIGIDEKILNKNGTLSRTEWDEMKKHPEKGWRILSATNEFSEVAQFVMEHHERWDGKGYPNGLMKEEISIESRIIAIADAYDAITSERSYRTPLEKKEAVKEIKRCTGKQFDPDIADIFLSVLEEKKFS